MPLEPNHGFRWRQAAWGEVLECEALTSLASHFFTTRTIAPSSVRDASPDGWHPIAVEAGVSLGRLCRLDQVHGTTVHVVRRGHDGSRTPLPEADAVVSDDPSVAVSVRVADCAPLLMADRRRGTVAAVHAGWRGAAARVVQAAVGVLCEGFEGRPADLVAAVGPCIGPCCYQVGPDVRHAFGDAGFAREELDRWFSPDTEDRLRLDLWAVVRDQLVAAGVAPGAIHVAGLCTATHVDRFFSFRVEGRSAGRLVAVIRARDSANDPDTLSTWRVAP